MSRNTAASRTLYELAALQGGYFTARQAREAGYEDNVHPYHVRSRNWVREARGVYRLSQFPLPARPDLMVWQLWSRNRQDEVQGVFSHATALSLHELSDVMPAKLHMTVPPGFRRMAAIPDAAAPSRKVRSDSGQTAAVRRWSSTSPRRDIRTSTNALDSRRDPAATSRLGNTIRRTSGGMCSGLHVDNRVRTGARFLAVSLLSADVVSWGPLAGSDVKSSSAKMPTAEAVNDIETPRMEKLETRRRRNASVPARRRQERKATAGWVIRQGARTGDYEVARRQP
jgi:hypothetical protein